MKSIRLSPVTFVLVALSLVVGILVCDLSGAAPTAHAQTGAPRAITITVSGATLSGSVIAAKGVVINGAATDAVFLNEIRVGNSTLDGVTGIQWSSTGGVCVLGAYPAPGPEPVDGAYPAPGPEPVEGAYPAPGPQPADGAYPAPLTVVGEGVQVTGGTLQGDNIQVTDGVITGENLVLVGAYVNSSGAQ